MKCKFCGGKVERVLYKDKRDSTYHTESLVGFDMKYEGVEVEVCFCKNCKNKIDVDKYIIFNALNEHKCFCLEELRKQ